MADSTDTQGGANIEGGVSTGGGRVTGRDDWRNDSRQNVNVEAGGNQWIIAQILDHGQQIRELTYRLDDIPNKFKTLQADVEKLQDVEITVRPDAVVIKPVAAPQSINLSMWTLLIVMIVALGIVIVMVALLYWQVAYSVRGLI